MVIICVAITENCHFASNSRVFLCDAMNSEAY